MTSGSPNPPLSAEVVEKMTVGGGGGCRLWTGRISGDGYAIWSHDAKRFRVHRWVHEQDVGPIPDDLAVDHQCHDPEICKDTGRNCLHRRCVNPKHLKAMPNGDNVRRGGSPLAWKSRQTHCRRQHELSGKNLYLTPGGRRQCRTCRSQASAIAYAKRTRA